MAARRGEGCVSTKLQHRGLTTWSSQTHTRARAQLFVRAAGAVRPSAPVSVCFEFKCSSTTRAANAETERRMAVMRLGTDASSFFFSSRVTCIHKKPQNDTHAPVVCIPRQPCQLQVGTYSAVMRMKMHIPCWLQRPCLCWRCLYSSPQPPAPLWRKKALIQARAEMVSAARHTSPVYVKSLF